MPDSLKTRYIDIDDLTDCYKIYYNNNKIDVTADLSVLSVDCYTQQEILDVLKLKNTRGICIDSLNKFQESYSNQVTLVKTLEGFLIYEVEGSKIDILILEASNKNLNVYLTIVSDLIAKAHKNKTIKTISCDVEDGRYDIMKALMSVSFKKKQIIKTNKADSPDFFHFERSV